MRQATRCPTLPNWQPVQILSSRMLGIHVIFPSKVYMLLALMRGNILSEDFPERGHPNLLSICWYWPVLCSTTKKMWLDYLDIREKTFKAYLQPTLFDSVNRITVSENKITVFMLEILLLSSQETVSRSQNSIRNTSSFQLSFVIKLWLSDLSQYAISLL